MNCTFCKSHRNTNKGLIATYKKYNHKNEVFLVTGVCPLGMASDPTTKESTKNTIIANGRFSMCRQNPWYWLNI